MLAPAQTSGSASMRFVVRRKDGTVEYHDANNVVVRMPLVTRIAFAIARWLKPKG